MNQLNDHTKRAHALLSPSSAHRWLECPPSAVIADRYPKQDTPFTREGTLAHEVAEAVVGGVKNPEAIDGVTAEMVRHAEEYRDYIDGLVGKDTLVLLEQRLDLNRWVPGGFGSADCILIHDDVMDVIDYKYGQGVAVSAVDNPQMMLYALGAINEYGFAYEIKTVRMHIFQPRLSNISVFEKPVEDLLAYGEVIVKPAAEKAIKGEGELEAGLHCRFCPHAGSCSQLAMYCIAQCSQAPDFCKEASTLTPEAVAYILSEEPVITMWLKKVKDRALADLLDGGEIPGYKVVEGKLGNRKWTDELKVAAALDAAGVARDDYTTLKLLSPAEMDKALGKKRAAELLADLIDRAPGSPTIAPASDKRPAYSREADISKDFDVL